MSPSIHRHQRQFVWQILLPIILIVVVGLAAGVLVAWSTFANQGDARLWADISLIWLLAPMLLLALIAAVVAIGLIYGIARLTKAAPRLTGRLQELVRSGESGLRRIADGSTKPFTWAGQASAALKSAARLLLGKK